MLSACHAMRGLPFAVDCKFDFVNRDNARIAHRCRFQAGTEAAREFIANYEGLK